MKYKDYGIRHQILFDRIKVISNPQRFKIIELTQENQLSITELCSKLKIAYNKCADYVSMLSHQNIIKKTKIRKEVKVLSLVKFYKNGVEFIADSI